YRKENRRGSTVQRAIRPLRTIELTLDATQFEAATSRACGLPYFAFFILHFDFLPPARGPCAESRQKINRQDACLEWSWKMQSAKCKM
ncbi:MAG TPA: hypothetical protein VN699_15195, partial [Pirellulales bacterium]|nr:hypothetical protein [Pirellulales bacterium]